MQKTCRRSDPRQWLRSQKPQKKYPFWRFDKVKFDCIKNGGWHFSYLETPDGIVKKIKSYAHTEYNLPEFTNEKKVEELINKQQDIFGRNLKFEPVKLDKTFPQYILENKILEGLIDAQNEYQIQSTPSFIINGNLLVGNKSIKEFRKIIDKILISK